MTTSPQWQRVSPRRPCGVCERTSYCLFDPRAGLALCTKCESDTAEPRWHGWLHQVEPTPDEYVPEAAVRERPPEPLDDDEASARDRLYCFLAAHQFARLRPDQREDLHRRGLDDEAIARHGYFSYRKDSLHQLVRDLEAFAKAEDLTLALWRLPGVYARDRGGGRPGFVHHLKSLHGQGDVNLAVPVRDHAGRTVAVQLRAPAGEPRYKFLSSPPLASSGAPVHVALPAGDEYDRSRVGITEGPIKGNIAADRLGYPFLCVAGVGNQAGVLPTIAALKARGVLSPTVRVAVAYDQEPDNPLVQKALDRLLRRLRRTGYTPVTLAWDRALAKGIDDALQAGADITEVEPLPDSRAAADVSPRPAKPAPYFIEDGEMVWNKPQGTVFQPVRLANFSARITADVTRDDGAEQHRAFEIEATLRGRTHRFTIPAERFNGMGWYIEQLGAGAIVYPGQNIAQHARTAIQSLSGADVPAICVYTHTGWRETDAGPVYLHGAGAIGPHGAVQGMHVELPEELQGFTLPDPPAPGEEERAAIRASLRLLNVAPDHITFPMFAAVYRAPRGGCDTNVWISGQSGGGKSEMAALGQQHYGAAMDARHFPGSWSSSGNALEALAFQAKDAVLGIDDFIPTGSSADRMRLHRDADRVMRAQGNGSGRQRLRADTSLRPAKPPRGLILGTGEETPNGLSLRSRMVIVEFGPDDMRWDKLSECQRDAAAGLYAQAMAGYTRHLAAHYDEWKDAQRANLTRLRTLAAQADMHRRTPDNTAQLALGLQSFLWYALTAGAINEAQHDALWERGWTALRNVAASQAAHQAASEPTRRFLELVSAALASGDAHVAAPDGAQPGETPEAWGWRKEAHYPGAGTSEEWRAMGKRIGWLDGANLYLEEDAAYAVAQHLGAAGSDSLGIGAQTLGKRLKDRGLLASWDKARGTNWIRRKLQGAEQHVWHLLAGSLSSPTQPDKTDIETSDGVQDAEESGIQAVSDAKPADAAMSGGAKNPTSKPDIGRQTPDIVSPPEWMRDCRHERTITFKNGEVRCDLCDKLLRAPVALPAGGAA